MPPSDSTNHFPNLEHGSIISEEHIEYGFIGTCLSSLDALITAETQKHETLKTHKKGLIQQLFPSPEEVEA